MWTLVLVQLILLYRLQLVVIHGLLLLMPGQVYRVGSQHLLVLQVTIMHC